MCGRWVYDVVNEARQVEVEYSSVCKIKKTQTGLLYFILNDVMTFCSKCQ